MVDLHGKKVVVVGVTGQVATPLAITLSETASVIGAARFSSPSQRDHLEAEGLECVTIDLENGDVGNIPRDADYILNFAVAKTNDWTRDLDSNVGGVLSLMEHCENASAFLQCSSTAVYKAMYGKFIKKFTHSNAYLCLRVLFEEKIISIGMM